MIKKRLIITSAILLFWAVSMFWLIRFEAFPGLFTDTIRADYRELLSKGPLLSDNWMKIIMQGVHVGYSHTSMDINEESPSERYQLQNTTDMNLNMLGSVQPVLINVTSTLDAFYKLQRFEFLMKSDRYSIRLNARRMEDERFAVEIRSPSGAQSMIVEIPPDVVLYSPVMEMALQQMQPGETTVIKTLDPATMRPMEMRITALRREEINWQGTNTLTTVFEYDYSGAKMHTWMDTEGQVLRQETPWGWTLEAADAADAVYYDYKRAAALDMTASLAIPTHPPIVNPRSCTFLRLKLQGGSIDAFDLNSHRQQAMLTSGSEVELTVKSDALPDADIALAIPDDAAKYLNSTMYIQCGHAAFRKTIRDIIGSETNPVRKVRMIADWVHREVKKDPTISLPSALDVLKTMRGDCNEHTYLFTALARAAGIPARVHVGVVYMDGALYYHAWPGVYLNRWVELDPTLGQPGVDATHISMLTGEIAEQVKLLNILGQTRATILEQRHD
jgi:hypothetical protein